MITLSLLGTSALADLSPDQVWTNWQAYMESYGYEVRAQTSQSDGVLTVSDIVADFVLPEDQGSMRVQTGPLTLTDLGNGTVGIAIPPQMPLTFNIDAVDQDPLELTLTYSHTGLEMFATGSPEDMGFDLSAAMLGLSLTDLVIADENIGTAKFDLVMQDVSGSSTMLTAETREMAQIMSAGSLTYDAAVADPEGSGNLVLNGKVEDVKMQAQMVLPLEVSVEDMPAALEAGLAMQGTLNYAGGSSQFSFVDGGDSASGSSSSESGSLSFAMSRESLQYGISSTGATVAVNGSDIPIPVNLSFAEMAINLMMPLAESADPQDFKFLLKLAGFAPDDMIWGMFDPTGALPHDPATLVVDIAGKANWLFDIFDPEAAEELSGPPGELHSVTVKELELSAAGASLTGIGDFTFNNDDLMTFDGMPAPTGSADLKLVGANTLIDKLIEMGMLSNEDALGARAMMGVMARPGDGPDTLVSTIEVKEDGSVFANGMQLQ